MQAPVQRVSTHPGIRIDKIPVSDATGLIFAIGSVAIFLTLPAVRLRFGGRVEGLAGASLVFLSRFLMDLVFIKLAVQILNAAYFRARGLGRGEDMLFTVKQEIEAGDVPRVKDLCQQVGDSLRDAVDTLRRYHEEGGDKAAMAWRCLVTMKDYAIPYLKTRHRAATGDERERIAKLIDRLESAPAEEEQPPRRGPGC